MIKDLIEFSRWSTEESAEKNALSVAAALDAHIAAVAFVYDPAELVSELCYIASGVIDAQWRDYKSEAKASLDRFSEEACRGAISAEP